MPSMGTAVNLRAVADYVGLAPCSVSAILNDTLAAKVIPQRTKDRVLRAAAELNYRPNIWARSLRTKRTRMIAALASDFGQASIALVIAGAQQRLQKRGYLLALLAFDCSDPNQLSGQLRQMGVDGLIAIDINRLPPPQLPVTSVEFGSAESVNFSTDQTGNSLRKLGTSAADAILRQIEDPTISRNLTVQSRPDYLGFVMNEPASRVQAR
jgi:Bacterial regulatory proteins, lacI family